ncbi:hypothetical protein A583_00910 [Corynebacterium glutamicum Z188]|uniref:Uncharacterized protein n=2 Tax=Corynebacterium glutamicum TaxID=1718 RepID=A0AB36I9G2_CORGT|nr:hypothetical protein C624_01385 [Corynebacterium glutamicum SCgG1]AGN20889.1 hypothetical protein C629_01385 [Corynebacterium glutamicum SCgG2]EGV39680.1 hypothetical protein CgS9114_11851 [Corynebacterium glutamicum S9114]EPP42000.1 hypothetical protein A583_00910 [Corynebacterium glutamicum Z188]OKX78062.1 hypothetical protein AUP70_09080 [Corynebacterium glutamicum]BAQ21075.1 hypothetical protein cgR_6013 [Corynebacterium glutamicum R]
MQPFGRLICPVSRAWIPARAKQGGFLDGKGYPRPKPALIDPPRAQQGKLARRSDHPELKPALFAPQRAKPGRLPSGAAHPGS